MFSRPQRHQPCRFDSGFTLIELLVVITIIAILVAIVVPVVITVHKDAKITTTRAVANSIKTSIMAYYHDNGYLPLPAPHDSTNNAGDLYFPSGLAISNKSQRIKELPPIYAKLTGGNPKGVNYLDADLNEEGWVADLWGTPFRIHFDANLADGIEIDSPEWDGDRSYNTLCIVESAGPNKTFDFRVKGVADDIATEIE